MRAPLAFCLATAFAGAVFGACHPKKPAVEPEASESADDNDGGLFGAADAAPAPSLYDRLGGKDGVAGIIDSLIANVQADKVVSRAFAKTKGPKLDHFKQMLADQICEAAGGKCQYAGKNMKDAHKGMGISDAQFAAFVTDLKLALAEKQVGEADQNALVSKLEAMQDDVVEKKSKK
jgi:hemoglobin